jgi:hypothetical protein
VGVLDEFTSLLEHVDDRPKFAKGLVGKATEAKQLWIPAPGPQTDAYFLLYGGQAGGGKSDLGLGMAFTQHQRSLILRRQFGNLSALVDRGKEIAGYEAYTGQPMPTFKSNGRLVHLAGCQHLGDEQKFQGNPYDLKVFDEATQFLELMVRFHIGWIRSTDKAQRCRAILASNPPLTSDGDWIIGFFRPWLDITHHNPAKPGELRWFVTDPDGMDLEVAGPETCRLGKLDLVPQSRTFIPAKLKDNPYLARTNYQAKLDALPEPVRSAVRDGNFMATREDDADQCIPTQWIIEAQARWTPTIPADQAMTTIAVDIAQGGPDRTVIQPRYGWYFSEQVVVAGKDTPDGSSVVGQIIRVRRDAANIVLDAGGGYGGSTKDRLTENGIPCTNFIGAAPTAGKTRDGLLGFVNKRAEAFWRMREELDPDQEGGSVIALPPDPEIRSDLAAARFTTTVRGIQIEPKDAIKVRLGRSTDKGDAAIMALYEGQRQANRERRRNGVFGKMPSRANMGYSPLKNGGAYGRGN